MEIKTNGPGAEVATHNLGTVVLSALYWGKPTQINYSDVRCVESQTRYANFTLNALKSSNILLWKLYTKKCFM